MDRVVEFRGCRLSFGCEGDGSTALFIQGVGVQGAGWRPQTNELKQDFRCVWFDNRGLGQSQPVGAEITVEQMAEDALAVLDAVGSGAAHIVGHSLGGLIALQLALSAPHRVRSLSLLCTFTGKRTAAPLSLKLIWLGMRSRIGTRSMRQQGFMRLVMPPGQFMDVAELSELFGHDIADQPPIVHAQLRAMRAIDLSSRLGELSGIPTLVATAAHDPIAPPRSGKALRDGIGGARYVEVADASHGLPISHAGWLNGLLREHFRTSEAVVRP